MLKQNLILACCGNYGGSLVNYCACFVITYWTKIFFQVLTESLRCCPITPALMKSLHSAETICGKYYPKGTVVMVKDVIAWSIIIV